MAESKKHHFVPQSVLRRFTLPGKPNSLRVFDKQTGQARTESVDSAGMRNHFNTVEVDGVRVNFEHEFQETDTAWGAVCRHLVTRRTLEDLTTEQRQAVIDGFATQMVRTQLHRSTVQHVAEAAIGMFQRLGLREDAPEPISEQDVRRLAREAFHERDGLCRAFSDKPMFLLEPEPGGRFWTSDHPILRFNNFPDGDIGLRSLGVEIYCPIAPDLVIGFLCPSIADTLQHAVDLGDGIEEPERSMVAIWHSALQTGRPTTGGHATPSVFINTLLVRTSSRFLYGDIDDFDLAQEILIESPQVSSVTSAVSVGQMGEAPQRCQNIPSGRQLTIIGSSGQYIAPFRVQQLVGVMGRDIEMDASPMIFAALADQPWQRVLFYEDGFETGGMHGVVAEARPQDGRLLVAMRNRTTLSGL